MIDALHIPATGLLAGQRLLDSIANNVANVNTPGFKKERVHFSDLMPRVVGPLFAGGALGAAPLLQGMGVAPGGIVKQFSVGDLRPTGNPLDVAINGQGFFVVEFGQRGDVAYTRLGSLGVNADGLLTTGDGLVLADRVHIPSDAVSIEFSDDGVVSVVLPDEVELLEVGQLSLAHFVNPGALQSLGRQLFAAADAAGPVQLLFPGEGGVGLLQQGVLEGSNVDLVDELIALVVVQRAFEASSQVIRAADEMLQMNNSVRR